MTTDHRDGFTDTLARWCAETPRIDSRDALKLARDAFKDTVGCMIAGSDDDITRRVKCTAARMGTGPACLVGGKEKLSASGAALVNGTAAHIYDYDDNFFPAAAHASAVLVPAILAVGETLECAGATLLDAYAIGLEAMGRVGEAVNYEHYERGWHATTTLGPIGAGAACARLLGLDHQEMHSCLSLAFSMAGGSKRQLGSMAKPLHAGLAAQHGVHAAWLAADGIRGIEEPFDGHWGFRDLFAGEESPGFETVIDKIGRPLAIEEYGLMPKIYPNCASVHCSADGVISLMSKHELAPSDIERVKVHVPKVTFEHLRYPHPRDELQARFSMQYGLALAIEQGEMNLSDFQPGAVERPLITDWYARIEMHRDDSQREYPVPANTLEPAEVHLQLKNGKTLSERVRYPRGVLQNPVPAQVMTGKFHDCVTGKLAARTAGELEVLLENIEGLSNIRELTHTLAQ